MIRKRPDGTRTAASASEGWSHTYPVEQVGFTACRRVHVLCVGFKNAGRVFRSKIKTDITSDSIESIE